VADDDLAFRLHAAHGEVVELVAVGGLRHHAAVGADARQRTGACSSETGWSPGLGGSPRPSLTWQPPQDRAMKCGPRPSRTLVEAGACTQLRLKKELPMTKRVRSSSVRLAAGKEKALRPVAKTVVSPPVFSPSGVVYRRGGEPVAEGRKRGRSGKSVS
jgi:hypothetical protein